MTKTDQYARKKKDDDKPVWIYGRHAVAAVLRNPDRVIHRLVMTLNAQKWLNDQGLGEIAAQADSLKPDAIDGMLPPNAVHQGVAVYTEDLPFERLNDVCPIDENNPTAPILVLDQVTDPQNIGALFRVAAAFGAKAVIVQERKTPPLSGALAKASVGAVDMIPCIKVVNIARAVDSLKDFGYHVVGLAGGENLSIENVQAENIDKKPVALVMGAEGAGIRPLVAEGCHSLAKIDIHDQMESLNVASAASIAFYATQIK